MLTNTIFSRLTRARLTASSSCFCFLFALSGIKREPQTRVGLVTSSLPRKRSTTELLRLAFYSHSLLSTFSRGVGLGSLSPSPLLLSGRRGSNPPPIAWKAIALPNELLPPVEVGLRGGGWTRTTELFRGQIYSLLQLPLCDSPIYQLSYIGCCHCVKLLFNRRCSRDF